MKSVMTPQQLFNKVAKPNIQRSTFDRSHGYKTTFDAGVLVPFFCDEALPGDTFNLKTTVFGRLATPLKPIMDNMFLDIHFFSVPYRLVWDNFQKFMGEQVDPGDSTDYVLPTMTAPAAGYAEGSTMDYLGIPTKIKDLEHQSLPLRAINLIYNEWYRDENLQDSVVVDTDDGPDTYTDYNTLHPRGKRKDYFTSSLPWAQKGDSVLLPLGDDAPIMYGDSIVGADISDKWYVAETDAGSAAYHYYGNSAGVSSGNIGASVSYNLRADLSNATAATINQIREAFQLQKLFERDARGGTRYIEMIYAHFGVRSPDQRLQRPEYLGGGTAPLNLNPIANTSATATENQGDLAGIGTFGTGGKGFIKSFTEHEFVIGFISARADLTYQQGLNRMWSRETRYDHYWPALAHIGEQAILVKELYAQDPATDTGATGTPDNERVFGYAERYAEYRYKPSLITGQFRSNATTSLDLWHLSQEFGSLPTLNSTFIEENPPMSRIIAVPSEPDFLLDVYFDFKCTRPMPTFSTPGLVDHF
jgi:hypothetical protein